VGWGFEKYMCVRTSNDPYPTHNCRFILVPVQCTGQSRDLVGVRNSNPLRFYFQIGLFPESSDVDLLVIWLFHSASSFSESLSYDRV